MLPLALEVSDATVVGAVGAVALAFATAARVAWSYWTRREEAALAAKDREIAERERLLRESLDRGRELSDLVARQGDEHADKIEELLRLTLAKGDEWGARQVEHVERFHELAKEIAEQLRRLADRVRGARS